MNRYLAIARISWRDGGKGVTIFRTFNAEFAGNVTIEQVVSWSSTCAKRVGTDSYVSLLTLADFEAPAS